MIVWTRAPHGASFLHRRPFPSEAQGDSSKTDYLQAGESAYNVIHGHVACAQRGSSIVHFASRSPRMSPPTGVMEGSLAPACHACARLELACLRIPSASHQTPRDMSWQFIRVASFEVVECEGSPSVFTNQCHDSKVQQFRSHCRLDQLCAVSRPSILGVPNIVRCLGRGAC